jgi:hypothetical protein
VSFTQGWVEVVLGTVCVAIPIFLGILVRTLLRNRVQLKNTQAL